MFIKHLCDSCFLSVNEISIVEKLNENLTLESTRCDTVMYLEYQNTISFC